MILTDIVFFTLYAVGIASFTLCFLFTIGKIGVLDGETAYLDEKRIFSFVGKYVLKSFCPICLNLDISALSFFSLWFVYDLQYVDFIFLPIYLGVSNFAFHYMKNFV